MSSTKVITFFSTKGGVGKTTISLNTALALSLLNKKVLLLELDLGGPLDMAKMLNLRPKRALVDMVGNWQSLKKNEEKIRECFSEVNNNLYFLPGVLSLRSTPHLKPLYVESILSNFRELGFDFIIIDGGKNLTDLLLKIFGMSNLILLVVTPDILSVYQTEWALDTLQSLGFPLKMVRVIVNRAESKGGVSLQEVKLLMPVELLGTLPSEGKVVGLALNRGVPVIQDSPHSKIAIALKDLASKMLEDESLYLPHKELAELKIKKEKEETAVEDFWARLGLVEPLKKMEISEEEDVIVEVKKKVHQRLIEELELRRLPVESILLNPQRSKKLREDAEKIVANILAQETGSFFSSLEVRRKLTKEIIDEALGLGPLEDLIKDPAVTEIMVNNKDQIYIEREGKIELTSKRFTSNEQVRVVIERILAPLGRRIDESSPYVDARLPDGSRVNAIIPPLSLTGPTLTIRKFARQRLTMGDLIDRLGSISSSMAKFLEAGVKSRKNILVSGGTGSGKTTFLNILSSYIPEKERIITIEDSAELKLNQKHWIRLETRPPNIEGRGEVTMRDLFRNSLRMRPDRIIVGECRGKEVLDMLQAMNTGHDGSMSTIHANSTHDVLIRLDSMILMSGVELPIRAIREMIASAIDLIVHTARLSDGSRKVVQITEVAGMLDETHINLQDIFIFRQTGLDKENKVLGYFTATGYIPSFFEEMEAKGLEVPREIFTPQE